MPNDPVTGYLALGALFGVLNAIIKPILQFMALPFLLQSLGAVVIIVDIGVFALLDALSPHLLSTESAIWIALAGLLLGLLSFILDNLFGLTPPIVNDRPREPQRGMNSRRHTQPELHERVRLLQVYEVSCATAPMPPLTAARSATSAAGCRTGSTAPSTGRAAGRPGQGAAILQELGPTYVKFGQIVSSRADSLPQDWERGSRSSRATSSRSPPRRRARSSSRSSARRRRSCTRTSSAKPLAAASLAQVIARASKDGRDVVVKLQRRGSRQGQVGPADPPRAAHAMERRSQSARDIGMEQRGEEFGSTLLLELDYTIEAYNARRLAQNLAESKASAFRRSTAPVRGARDHHGVHRRRPRHRREAIVAAGLDPVAIADAAVRASIKMLLIDGFFHADPHPGNVIVSLDTGSSPSSTPAWSGRSTLKQRFSLIDLLTTAGQRDPLALAQALRGVSQPMKFRRPTAGAGGTRSTRTSSRRSADDGRRGGRDARSSRRS